MAQGPASKPFVVPSKMQDLAGTIGTLAGGADMAADDAPMEEKPRRITAPNGGANRRSRNLERRPPVE
jgi:hypothetical protein